MSRNCPERKALSRTGERDRASARSRRDRTDGPPDYSNSRANREGAYNRQYLSHSSGLISFQELKVALSHGSTTNICPLFMGRVRTLKKCSFFVAIRTDTL